MIVSLADFTKLSEKERKNTLHDLKEQIGVSGIVEAWGISRSKVYSMMLELNIPTGTKGSAKAETSKTTSSRKVSSQGTGEMQAEQKSRSSSQTSMPVKNRKDRKTRRPRTAGTTQTHSSLEEGSKFSLQMDTQGSASTISQTLQVLLASGKFADSNLHLNLMLEEV